MGLRCLIGHNYDPPQTAREREERGDEVVITEREYRECSRCGHREVVSENTEVKANPERTGTPDPEPSSSTDAPTGSTAMPDEYDDVAPEKDDGVILDDDPEAVAERQRGQWPDVEPAAPDRGRESASTEHTPWPDAEGDDEGFDAEPADGEGPSADITFHGGGLTPERSDEGPVSAVEEDEETVGSDTPADLRDPDQPAETGADRLSADDGPTEFVCPDCGFTRPAAESSLRPGDICPDCRQGYLTEAPRE